MALKLCELVKKISDLNFQLRKERKMHTGTNFSMTCKQRRHATQNFGPISVY